MRENWQRLSSMSIYFPKLRIFIDKFKNLGFIKNLWSWARIRAKDRLLEVIVIGLYFFKTFKLTRPFY